MMADQGLSNSEAEDIDFRAKTQEKFDRCPVTLIFDMPKRIAAANKNFRNVRRQFQDAHGIIAKT
jgi:hypothetical protein